MVMRSKEDENRKRKYITRHKGNVWRGRGNRWWHNVKEGSTCADQTLRNVTFRKDCKQPGNDNNRSCIYIRPFFF